jgi:hypothetical protein
MATAGKTPPQIPVLTEIIGPDDTEALIAELQTRMAAATFALTEELMRAAFAEMEARLLEQVSENLRRQLPELLDQLLREHLSNESEEN